MKLGLYLTAYIKINSKWVKDFNVRPPTIKLKQSRAKSSLKQVLAMFFKHNPRNMGNKSKNGQVGFHPTKNFETAKETLNKVKRQPIE